MNVFVSGATGVLGTPVVRKLVEAGHHVRGFSRSAANREKLLAAGAEPLDANLFDSVSLQRALVGMSVVLHLATRIPPADSIVKPGAWLENDRIRDEGTRNLVDAALTSDVTTFIYPGIVFGYPDSGSEWIDSAVPTDDLKILASSGRAEAAVERFARAGRRGITLRMGGFYGPSAPNALDILKWARWGIAGFFGAADAYQPLIWVDDAAGAVVTAVTKGHSGIYDVVDDEPLTRTELASALARAMGKRKLWRPPTFLLKALAGKDAMFLARSQRVSNRRFREAAGWRPAVPDAREGLKRLVESAGLKHDLSGATNDDRRSHISGAETVSVLDRLPDARQRR